MATILLIRHGETDYIGKRLAGHLPGVHLNAKGRQQAEKLAVVVVSTHPVKAIYSSPLERAQETATPLAVKCKISLQLAPGLMEVNFGNLQGKTAGQLERLKLWKQVHVDPSSVHFPGGESYFEAQHRAISEIERIQSIHGKDDLVVCVSHADTIRLIITHYLHMPLKEFQCLTIDPASISTLRFTDNRFQLLNMNEKLEISA